jgi:hypothetical protein
VPWYLEQYPGHVSRNRHSNALQNTCEAVELGGEAYSLSSCKDLTSDLGTDFKVQWTVVDGENGNTTFRGVIDAAAKSASVDWAGFGFNQDLAMIGGNAFIVKICSSCASGGLRWACKQK